MSVRHTPLRSKLRYVILTTCSVALLVACGVLFAIQFYFFRKDYQRDLASVAEMIARTSQASVISGDHRGAEKALAGLAAKPHITGAQLFKHTEALATYGTLEHDFAELPPPAVPRAWREGSNVLYSQPVTYRGERLGTLYLVSDYGALASGLLSLYLIIFCGVLALSVSVGWLISTRLARFITGPLEQLASTVRKIAGSNDYTVRAEKVTEDEVGAFTDSFNQMIERIQGRDADLRREIAERERTESELHNMQMQLLDASRQAGMAEVATGVLHNVGNVLNSVNVSATLVAEKLNLHRLNNLRRTAELLHAQNGDLGEFFTTDPKGRLVPSYLTDLSNHLLNERQEALLELDLLSKNIEHIKEIVSMQQNYARVAGLIEHLTAESLVEDALRMTTGSLQRHHIDVVRDYTSCPPVSAERHKVLQILVNLIRNAKQSMDEASPATKTLTFHIRTLSRRVGIAVQDNGVGISASNLTRIFSHGFTTRKDGHGFGLHSAALAAQQMNGLLTVHSDGPGRGAIFTLELPVVRIEAAA